MADSGNSSHLSTGGKSTKIKEDCCPGPVPMHHLLKLGAKFDELQRNPYGAEAPSHKSTIKNGGAKGW